jgi:hypothetical protein
MPPKEKAGGKKGGKKCVWRTCVQLGHHAMSHQPWSLVSQFGRSRANLLAVQVLAQLNAAQATYKAACRRNGVPMDKQLANSLEEAIQASGTIDKARHQDT